EDRDGLVVDHVLDLVAERHAGPFVVVMRSSWIVPSASGAASARLTIRCCSTSETPSNASLATVTWKWSPPPVRSRTSTCPPGKAASSSVRIVSATIDDDANDGATPGRVLSPLPARAPRQGTRRHARRDAPRDLRARPASPRAEVTAVRGDGEEPPARDDRARRRRSGARSGRGRARAQPRQARRPQGRRKRRRARVDRSLRLLTALGARGSVGRDPRL